LKCLKRLSMKKNYHPISSVFTTAFLLILSGGLTAKGQGVTPPGEYFTNITIADSLSEKGRFQAAAAFYSDAFKAFGGRGMPDDRYKAARAWALTGNKDSALSVLNGLCSRSRYWNYLRFADDAAFTTLKGTPVYDDLITCFKKNKESYAAEINVVFYNALDSIYLESRRNMMNAAWATSGKDAVNLRRITALLDLYGWPSQEAVGFWGYSVLCSAITQSSPAEYKKYHGMLDNARLKANPLYNSKIAATLDSVLIADQHGREAVNTVQQRYGIQSKQYDSLWKSILYYDSINLAKVKPIIDTYGWPGKEVVGQEGSRALFLVIQHADLATQEKYLPVLREAVKNGKARPSDLALLEDRVLTRNGKPQIYGSQVRQNYQTGKNEFFPIEDIPNVNKRRASAGLSSLEEYAKLMGVNTVPK